MDGWTSYGRPREMRWSLLACGLILQTMRTTRICAYIEACFVLFVDSLILFTSHPSSLQDCFGNSAGLVTGIVATFLIVVWLAYRARNPMACWFGCAVIGIADYFSASMLCILLSASSEEMLYFCCGYSFSVGQCLVLSDALCLIFTRFTKIPILVMSRAYLHLRWRLERCWLLAHIA